MEGNRTPQKNKITDNALVAMRNDIIPILGDLKFNEMRLFQFILTHYDSRSAENYTFVATINDLKAVFGMGYHTAYSIVRRAFIDMSMRPLVWRKNNARRIDHWFTGMTFYGGNGRFEFRINRDTEWAFLLLKDCFTSYRVGDIKRFARAASFKMYLNLKQRLTMGEWKADLEDLRYRLGIVNKYPRWSSLKDFIIDPAIDDINKHSDLIIKWHPVKRGRKIVGVEFTIRKKSTVNAEEIGKIHEANQFLTAAEEEEKRLGINQREFDSSLGGTITGTTNKIDVGSKKQDRRKAALL